MSSNKKRAPNFSKAEKEALVTIVTKYKHIIENKKTDSITCQEKNEAWFKITTDFNALSPNMTFRTTESLKKYWANIKEDLRKRMGESRRSLYKTGGGPPPPDNSKPDDDRIMSIVNKKVITGLSNMFDSDALGQDANLLQANIGVQEETHNKATISATQPDIEIIYENDYLPETFGETLNEMETESENLGDRDNNVTEPLTIWPVQTKPDNLRKPINKALNKNVTRVRGTTARGTAGTTQAKQRRPGTIRILSSSILGEKYTNLVDKKIELAECLKKEHVLRMKLLKYDVALKERELTAAGIDITDIQLLESSDVML